MVFDRADWHYNGDYPDDLSKDRAFTHIGMFLWWIIDNGLIGELHKEESQESIAKIHAREITGSNFLKDECDEKFWSEDLSNEGIEFSEYYYDAFYYDDYEKILGENLPTLYHVEDNVYNYQKIAHLITKRYNTWKKNHQKEKNEK